MNENTYLVLRSSEAHPQGGTIGRATDLSSAQRAAQDYEDMLLQDADEPSQLLRWQPDIWGHSARSALTGQGYRVSNRANPPMPPVPTSTK